MTRYPNAIVTDFGTVRLCKKTADWLANSDRKTGGGPKKRLRKRIKRLERAACVLAEIEWRVGGLLKTI